MNEQTIPVLTFDPGATTGVAVLDAKEVILATFALVIATLEGFVSFTKSAGVDKYFTVVVEEGPHWRQNSPITKRAEGIILDAFPTALLVQPNQWKDHPASKKNGVYRFATRHEKDAVGIGRWFQATRSNSAKDSREDDSSRTHPKRS